VFQSVRRKRRRPSSTRALLKRRDDPAGLAAYMYQRVASAPCWSMTVQGSTALPRLLDILLPFSSRMWPRQMTFLKAMLSGIASAALRSVASAWA
jgi:hypothetical protein